MGLGREAIESCVVIGGLIGMQASNAVNSVLLSYLMLMGLNPLSLIVFTALFAFLILSPVCLCLERSQWPKKLSVRLWVKLFLIAIGGVTLFQLLFLKGIKLTSPVMATALPNLSPGLIFIIAWAFRLERVKISSFYSQAKIVGTVLCVIGGIAMSIMQSTIVKQIEEPSSSPQPDLIDKDKIIGSMFLMAGVLVLSIVMIIQAMSLVEFPAPVSLCAITSLIGSVFTAAVELIQDHKFDYGWPVMNFGAFLGYCMLGGALTGGFMSFSAWAIKKRGPVLVSVFNPVGTICSLVLSAILLGEYMNLGSIVSMFVVFGGLYLVMWAKGKEENTRSEDLKDGCEAEKALLG